MGFTARKISLALRQLKSETLLRQIERVLTEHPPNPHEIRRAL